MEVADSLPLMLRAAGFWMFEPSFEVGTNGVVDFAIA
jgi:hypothetical protein